MDFSDEFLVNNHIPVFLERLIYSPVTVVGGSLSPLFFLPPRPTGTPPISSAMSRGRGLKCLDSSIAVHRSITGCGVSHNGRFLSRGVKKDYSIIFDYSV